MCLSIRLTYTLDRDQDLQDQLINPRPEKTNANTLPPAAHHVPDLGNSRGLRMITDCITIIIPRTNQMASYDQSI